MLRLRRGPLLVTLLACASLMAQEPPGPPPAGRGFGPGGGGPMGEEKKLLKQHDRDRNGWLDRTERKAAREAVKADRARGGDQGRGPGGRGGPFGPEDRDPPKRGIALKPSDVKPVPESAGLYDLSVLRTVFLEFEDADWEAELSDFQRTDVEVIATLVVDGKRYPGVGVSFRGASSLFTVGTGWKRSLNVSVDAVDGKQRVLGYKTLNLLNCHSDPSFLHAVLCSHVARQSGVPAPKVNFVRVAINGENWGVYANAQQFDRIMVAESFPDAEGARWKVPGSPRGRGGLEYLGADLEEYKRRFELKASEGAAKAWKDLVALCRVLNETPLEELEAALAPILDVDGVLRFLAVELVLSNEDGYWTRASDYSMFQDKAGRFHLMPHDMNEAFGGGGMPFGRRRGPPPPGGDDASRPSREPAGPGSRPGGFPPMHRGGPTLDPLIGLDDPQKPLRSRLLAVPALRERYLRHVRDVAATWLDWERLGPVVASARALIDREVEIDTRKLSPLDAFRNLTSADPPPAQAAESGERRGPLSLRAFAEQRRRFLLGHPEISKLGGDGDPPAKDR